MFQLEQLMVLFAGDAVRTLLSIFRDGGDIFFGEPGGVAVYRERGSLHGENTDYRSES